MQTRPPLQATYSAHHTTVYVRPQVAPAPAKEEAFVYCQWKRKACARDSFSHGVHTALYTGGKWFRAALCLPAPTASMTFPLKSQGQEPRSPLRREDQSFMDWS